MANGMKCTGNSGKCDFVFSGPGEFRNAQAYLGKDGKWRDVCPKCGAVYVKG